MTQSRPSTRPTTPLRRISSHSLRSLSLSHSQLSSSTTPSSSTSPSSTSTQLTHLSPLFTELSNSVQDLVENCQNLSSVSKDLDLFNQGFASYLYGLRINGYTFDFKHPPNKINFQLSNERRMLQQEQQEQFERERLESNRSSSPNLFNTEGEDEDGDRTATMNMGDSTFVTNDEQSFIQPQPQSTTSKSRSTTTPGTGLRGGGSNGTRGRGGSGIARGRGGGISTGGITRAGGGGGISTKRLKEEMSLFADPIFPLLPINLRENRRTECEKVLWQLKIGNPQGLGLSELTKKLSNQTPPVPQVRINEVLLALVRAKVATKGLVKGVNLYRLDETRFS
ncbi:hypothetical protein JCM5350_005232 [Sporobolomyces pararoseus]